MARLKVDWKMAIVAFFGFHLLPMFVTGLLQAIHTNVSLTLGPVTRGVEGTLDLTALLLSQPWWEFVAPFGVGYVSARFSRFGPLATALLVEAIAFALRALQLPTDPRWLLPAWAAYDLLGVIVGWYAGRRPVQKAA
jgi:hypothetical protein